ncbi:MAG: cytochrome b/b6 domain-containing protein [Deltaproteobacteria bacterium]|nr:cytochrome b/b6 domain-containing protein [Deltaproteobacteria bacterium]
MGMIKRYGMIVILEHWLVAISGIGLIFTGLGCLPLFKRYYISEIYGLKWTEDFHIVTQLHYIFAVFFMYTVLFHVFFHLIRREFGLLPKKGDLGRAVKMIFASFGIGKEPKADKWLPEQRWAYVLFGIVIFFVSSTGMLKVLKNLEWVLFHPETESFLNLLHTISGGIFILFFVVHVLFVLVVKANWPLLKAIFTGKVKEEYAKRRHPIWYEREKS